MPVMICRPDVQPTNTAASDSATSLPSVLLIGFSLLTLRELGDLVFWQNGILGHGLLPELACQSAFGGGQARRVGHSGTAEANSEDFRGLETVFGREKPVPGTANPVGR